MALCPNCGSESGHEFCAGCGEYVGLPSRRAPGDPVPPPAAVLPGPELPRPPIRRRTGRVGEVPCGGCGAYGPAGRTFCARCGGLVSPPPEDVFAPPVPWWRRALGRLARLRRRGLRWTPIGPRQPLDRDTGRRWRLPVVVVLALVTVLIVVPLALGVVRRLVTMRYEPVRASAASGSATVGHHSSLMLDGLSNKSWVAPPTSPHGIVVRFDFPEPVDIDRLGVTQGAGEQPDAFARYARPARLGLVFDDGTTATVRLADEPGFQSVRVRARQVRWVRMTVERTYPGSVPKFGAALAELEFFRLA